MGLIKVENGDRLLFRTLILNTQIGNLNSCMKHYVRGTEVMSKWGSQNALKEFMLTELADCHEMLKALAGDMRFDWDAVQAMGKARRDERRADFQRKASKGEVQWTDWV